MAITNAKKYFYMQTPYFYQQKYWLLCRPQLCPGKIRLMLNADNWITPSWLTLLFGRCEESSKKGFCIPNLWFPG